MFHNKDEHPRDPKKWEPHADDAIKLAALRWFACTIEAQAIQIYATDSGKYEAAVAVMRASVDELRDLTDDIEDSGECPPGYVLCGRECAPMCDGEEE